MKNNQDTIEQFIALINGTLKGKQKETLLSEIQNDSELAGLYDVVKKMHQLTPQDSNKTISAAKKLSKVLFQDFQHKQNSDTSQYGVQVFDSSLLPIPDGVRPAAVDTRLLKYQFDNSIVELTIYPITVDSVEIIGQISNLEKSNQIIVTAETDDGTHKTNADEFNLFRFERVSTGDCKLIFSNDSSLKGVIELKL